MMLHQQEQLKQQEEQKESWTFNCTPPPDAFLPCENLLEEWWQRIAVWIISLLGIVANTTVIVHNLSYLAYAYINHICISVPTFLLTNLAMADCFMSVYVLFIAVMDTMFRDNFSQSALAWQYSYTCNLAGFLSVLSVSASALCLALITFERFYAITNSLDFTKRINIRFAIVTMLSIWAVSSMLATLPIFNINTFSSYAICLPFDTSNFVFKLYVVFLNCLIVVCFAFICVCYGMILLNTVVAKRASLCECSINAMQTRLRNMEDQKLVKNVSLLVMANIICWGPVVYLCGYSIIVAPLDKSYLKILAVLVIPFNSLINPFLYCICKKNFRVSFKKSLTKAKIQLSFR